MTCFQVRHRTPALQRFLPDAQPHPADAALDLIDKYFLIFNDGSHTHRERTSSGHAMPLNKSASDYKSSKNLGAIDSACDFREFVDATPDQQPARDAMTAP